MAVSIGSLLLDLRASTKGLRKDAGRAVQDFRKMGNLAAKAVAAGFAAGGGFAIFEFAKFQKAFAEVKSITSGTAKELKSLELQTISLSAALGTDLTESAKGLYQTISAGIPKENAITFLDVASRSAIAGVTDVATAVDGLSSVVNAFKINAADVESVADVMFTTVRLGKTTFEELSSSIANVAPVAAALGVDFKEVFASVSTLTKSGVKTTVAMTQLRAALISLLKPNADMVRLFQELNVETGQQLLDQHGLVGALEKLNSVASRPELAKAMGQVEGLSALLLLTGKNAKTFASDFSEITNATGSMNSAFNVMQNTLTAFVAKAKAQFLGVLLPVISEFYDKWVEKSGGVENATKLMRGTIEKWVGRVLVALGYVSDVFYGWQLIIAGLRLLYAKFAQALVWVNMKIAKAVDELQDKIVAGWNLLIEQLNRIKFVNIAPLVRGVDPAKKVLILLEAVAEGLTETVEELNLEFAKLIVEGKPSVGILKTLEDVRAKADEATAAIIANRVETKKAVEDLVIDPEDIVPSATRENLSTFFTETITAASTMFDVIENGARAIGDQIWGLIDGTQTWRNALESVAETIFTTITNALIQVAAQWLASQLAVALGTQAIQQAAATKSAATTAGYAAEAQASWTPAAIAASIATMGSAAWVGLGAFTAATAIGTVAAGAIGLLGSAATAAVAGSRAQGGPVNAGEIYQVNENGPEFFQPRVSGDVIPMGDMDDFTRGGGTVINQVINVSTGVAATVRAEIVGMLPTIKQVTVSGVEEARVRRRSR